MSPVDPEIDSLSSLEERIQQTAQLIARLRREREDAVEAAAEARADADLSAG
jgi:hypothetical protein